MAALTRARAAAKQASDERTALGASLAELKKGEEGQAAMAAKLTAAEARAAAAEAGAAALQEKVTAAEAAASARERVAGHVRGELSKAETALGLPAEEGGQDSDVVQTALAAAVRLAGSALRAAEERSRDQKVIAEQGRKLSQAKVRSVMPLLVLWCT